MRTEYRHRNPEDNSKKTKRLDALHQQVEISNRQLADELKKDMFDLNKVEQLALQLSGWAGQIHEASKSAAHAAQYVGARVSGDE